MAKKKRYDEVVLMPWFSKYIRVRDAQPFTGLVKCFTCGGRHNWKEMDCGHGVGRQHMGTKYHEQNNHSQCTSCNVYNEGRKDVYMVEVDKRYGTGTWNKLLILSRGICKRAKFEFDVMAKYYREEFERIKKEKNI